MARPAGPLSSIETSTPARLPATLATWFSVSETANVEDRISSPISRCTIESCASLARLAQSTAANATAIAAARLKNQARDGRHHRRHGEHGEHDQLRGPGAEPGSDRHRRHAAGRDRGRQGAQRDSAWTR